ncbi:hypothetical protein BU24DRAFT_351568 [Aaosphaeria arxii CBS 175.79]|uniref:Uncharacterized protein n=1 Tax=Aaosphaeria arxii CBS 175.79 TaxID=1450172 RepID=A0A6A5XHR8_9PLEO|nr:uncharacterized protein BU24DRAFT_351568 [Aaosphaeria arxii CBS 175.79]KAF2012662.1 hypothetical protein BU24DRAFT_351568 [Aaosphaeria arxii CBS 175.79]
MAEGTPSEAAATSSQIHPLLRQRMLNRAATFSEGAQPFQPPNRRRSSILSDYSDTRPSFRSSTDNLLRPGGHDAEKMSTSEEPSFWHSAPLAFAILPALGGLLFQNGSAVVTDVLLLLFASMFLNWCVRAPWDWYYAAQLVQYIDDDEDEDMEPPNDTIPEGVEDGPDANDTDNVDSQIPSPANSKETASGACQPTAAQNEAYRELARDEIMALIACFIGPLLGTYLLHAIRSQLTRPAEGLVSNYNLTIFVMAAEIRPISHVIKLKQDRMAHLQRIVRRDRKDQISGAELSEISRRLADIEARTLDPTVNSDVETSKISASVRQGLQPQLDALNRAVRRYEKRQAAQSIQIEARFLELDARLKDALALAAAAARTGQRPGMITILFTWIVGVLSYGIDTSWAIATYPFRLMNVIAQEMKSMFIGTDQQPRKRVKGQNNGASSISMPRMQARNAR